DYRSRYQKLNLAIEAALQNKAENINEHNNKYDKLLQDLIYVRWSGLPFWHYLLSLPETFREFSGDYVDQAACMPRKENFHNWVYNANTTVNSAPNSPFLRKGVLQKMAQMWEGNVGTRFIDMNIPHPISTLTFEKDGSATEVSDNRYPSVTTAGSNGVGLGRIIAAGFDIASFNTAGVGEYFEGGNGEDILPEYSEFLRICRDKKIGVLLTSHQTMISRQHIKGGSKTEDESGRVNQLRGLEKDHPNYFCLVQPFYGSFFEKYGSYNETKTFAQFKENVIDAFTSESPEKTGCALPAIFNDKPGSVEAYRQTLGDLFDQVHGIFFENKEVIGLPSWMKGRETPWNGISNLDENQKQKIAWQSFLLYFYVFQQLDLNFRLQELQKGRDEVFSITHRVAQCKDAQDRAGTLNFIKGRLFDLMLDREFDPEKMKEKADAFIGVCIANKKQGVNHWIKLALQGDALRHHMPEENKAKLRDLKFCGYKLTNDEWVKGARDRTPLTIQNRQYLPEYECAVLTDHDENFHRIIDSENREVMWHELTNVQLSKSLPALKTNEAVYKIDGVVCDSGSVFNKTVVNNRVNHIKGSIEGLRKAEEHLKAIVIKHLENSHLVKVEFAEKIREFNWLSDEKKLVMTLPFTIKAPEDKVVFNGHALISRNTQKALIWSYQLTQPSSGWMPKILGF
ncbi:MAG TPA: hypothetical protein PLO43_04055, partial [Chlamydiales bacterium]|nr:hypothetical protein [Chlamydiales bacterium]